MRLFAAIDLSPGTQDAMAAEQKRIAASLGSTAAPLKWVRPDHAHLTRGIPIEGRDFRPHLTLARWTRSRPSDRHRALALGRSGAIARQRVEWATLYESRRWPSGATYVPLTRATLTRTWPPPSSSQRTCSDRFRSR